jgi:[acyl-carrier-protein] S-malonyltransferase
VTSLVVLDAVERVGIAPATVAGHSLGEYTALTATGALSFEDGVRLVAARGEAMQRAADSRPGTMAAILGLADDDADAACRRADGDVWVANFNAPGQVVIAGSVDAVERASDAAKALGAKRVMALQVGGAFHTQFMAPARDELRAAVEAASIRDPEIAVLANIDARPHESARSGRACCRAAVQPGALAPDGAADGGRRRRHLRRARPRRDPHRDGQAHRPEAARDQRRHARRHRPPARGPRRRAADPPGQPDGEHLFMTERMVVSPAAGVFTVDPRWAAHEADAKVDVGDLLGTVGAVEVRSLFSGVVQGFIAVDGERVPRASPSPGCGRVMASSRHVSGGDAAITGWGTALPEHVVTNADFAARLDTTDEWIRERSGIRERRMGGTTGTLSIEAGRAAMKDAGVDPSTVDLLVLATSTPDQQMPATASFVHDALGLSGGAFDLNAACSGFVYAWSRATAWPPSGPSASS